MLDWEHLGTDRYKDGVKCCITANTLDCLRGCSLEMARYFV